jgi:para-aminobenzoate synthetase component 1
LAQENLPAVLDSAGGPSSLCRFTILACDPFRVLQFDGSQTADAHPFRILREELSRWRLPETSADVPLRAGAIGFLAYDLGRYIERLPARACRNLALPDMYWAFYDSVLLLDRHSSTATAWAADLAGRDPESLLRRWERLINESVPEPRNACATAGLAPPCEHQPTLDCNFTPAAYLAAVRRAKDYIAAGDIFQVNLSQRFTAPLLDSPAELFLRLRRSNPAPFAAYLAADDWAVLSSSPERYLQVSGRAVATRPIKGTRPRRDPALDPTAAEFNRRNVADLLASAKDAAELAMIVDLERNDLGRVCSYGSVRVTERRTVEEYAGVFHTVAQVEGRLHDGRDLVDLLRATFPGGSITGAPKVRAMEIIDELEPTARSLYTGAVGYIGFDGRLDLNIAIRTLLVDRHQVHLQVGGGIVADSAPEEEYLETLDKARNLFQAIGLQTPGATL